MNMLMYSVPIPISCVMYCDVVVVCIISLPFKHSDCGMSRSVFIYAYISADPEGVIRRVVSFFGRWSLDRGSLRKMCGDTRFPAQTLEPGRAN